MKITLQQLFVSLFFGAVGSLIAQTPFFIYKIYKLNKDEPEFLQKEMEWEEKFIRI